MFCVYGRMQECYSIIYAWAADYFEIIHFNTIKQSYCPMC